MKRPMLLFSVFLIAGISVVQIGSLIITILLSILIIVPVTIIILRKKDLAIVIGIILFYLAGAIEFTVVNNINSDKYSYFSEKDVKVNGFICSEPDIKEAKTVYTIKTREIICENKIYKIVGKLLLTVPDKGGTPIMEYGTEIRIFGRINIPTARSVPGGFDYRRYLYKSGISASLFARFDNIEKGNSNNGNFLVKAGLDVRKRIIDTVKRSLPSEQAALMNGMLIGFTSDMNDETTGAFSDAGLSHLMAVSGMNVAFIVFPLMFVFKRLKLSQKVSNIAIIGVLIIFIFITGFSPSVARAVIMAIIMLSGQLIRKETDVYTSISFAAILLLLYNPYTLFDIGFQLSFCATLSLVLFYKNIKNKLNYKFLPSFVADVLAATLAAQVGVIPISALYFNKISVISVVSNLVVVPLVELITIIGIIMVIIGQFNIFLAQMIGLIDNAFLSFILFVTKVSSSLPFAVVKIATPSVTIIILYYIAILFFLWYKPNYNVKLKYRWYAAFISMVILVFGINYFIPRDLEVVFIDVGQGDSELIKTSSGKTVLIDGGGFASKTDFKHNMGDYTVVPFLYDYGVTKLDIVISTHSDDDHLQGLLSVLKDIKADSLIIPKGADLKPYKVLLDIADTEKVKTMEFNSGDFIDLDGQTKLQFINPIEGVQLTNPENNGCIVAKLIYKNIKVLFTGDMEKEMEKILLNEKEDVKSDVLKVAHHGSSTSTSEDFLRAVGPEVAVISVGKNNSFGHPSKAVLKRLEDNGVKMFRTDMEGTIIMKTNGDTMKFWKTLRN
ncbi:MAG: DNA internalization-related competence protein ComEC/Rec2 [Bacillota bacterium]|nr:DNA internalization-related competence protein ComEC/Rec2 [Bacillota bacterium]